MISNKYNTRADIINNSIPEKDSSYLEIGICSGDTFRKIKFNKKIGVDPNPHGEGLKCTNHKVTSDYFFSDICKDKFDVIFIDGLHESEQVIRDFNNSMDVINENSIIIFDDIYPNNEKMCEVPRPKTGPGSPGSPWTGDCWKVLYHLILNISKEKYDLNVYTGEDYFGVATIEIKENFKLTDFHSNKYSYKNDFKKYTELLNTLL
jgi:hypothetical protein